MNQEQLAPARLVCKAAQATTLTSAEASAGHAAAAGLLAAIITSRIVAKQISLTIGEEAAISARKAIRTSAAEAAGVNALIMAFLAAITVRQSAALVVIRIIAEKTTCAGLRVGCATSQ